MKKPTGKLAFAYQSIANLEAKIEQLTAENGVLREEVELLREKCAIQRRIEAQNQSEINNLEARVITAEQERDRLKAQLADIFIAEDVCAAPFKNAMARHDADVIETWLKRLPISNRAVRISDVRKSAQDYANQLRQQAKEVQS